MTGRESVFDKDDNILAAKIKKPILIFGRYVEFCLKKWSESKIAASYYLRIHQKGRAISDPASFFEK